MTVPLGKYITTAVVKQQYLFVKYFPFARFIVQGFLSDSTFHKTLLDGIGGGYHI